MEMIREWKKSRKPKRHEIDRFIKAVELLGSGNPVNVACAAYALERLARGSAAARAMVVDALCAYFRIERRYDPEVTPKEGALEYLAPHLGAVFFVLTKLNKAFNDVRLDFFNIDLRNIYLNLNNAKMSLRKASLKGAHLEGIDLCRAHLEGASLWGAHLEGAQLYEAHLEEASLYEAHLEGACLSGANLKGANLYQANLEETDLYLTRLEEACLWQTNLLNAKYGVHIWQAKWDAATTFSNGQMGTPDVPKPEEEEAGAAAGKAI